MESSTTGNGSSVVRQSRQTRRRKSNVAGKRPSLKPDISLEPKVTPQRVFLYMKLKNIFNLPVVSYPLELHLYHTKNTLQKMSERYTTDTIIWENEFKMDKPAFAMGITQDSIDDMNIFSDNPLVVSLYQRIPRHRRGDLKTVKGVRLEASAYRITVDTQDEQQDDDQKGEQVTGDHVRIMETCGKTYPDTSEYAEADMDEGEDANESFVEESLEFLSRGHCDLLQLFQCKRFISNVPIMLYAEYDRMLETSTCQKITTTSEWHMYSILPVLKNFHFTNLAFITLESIYNVPEQLHQRAGHLGISVSIRPTDPDSNDGYQVYPICTFYGFMSQIIGEQNTIIVWESIKRDLLREDHLSISNNQMHTSLNIKLPRLFRELLKTPDVDLKINDINQLTDFALINNSLHRYVLTSKMQEILEAAVVHNQYEVLLQLYDEVPNNVLYEGVINPSVFGYPKVNSCRFATALYPLDRRSRRTNRLTELLAPGAPMFSIMRICFFQSLTTGNEPLDAYNESNMKTAKLRRCMGMKFPRDEISCHDTIKELYRNFDDLIKEMISFIVKNDVTSIDEKRNNLCCHLGNLRNLLVDICGSDFNVRMPTKTNMEFREMLTHMHAELMERIEKLLIACSWESPSNCIIYYANEQITNRRLMQEYRNMCQIGECALAKQMFAELSDCNNKLIFNFYLFLNSVENMNFEKATIYLNTQRASNWNGDYFVALLEIYVNYKMQLKSNELMAEAYSNMLDQLRNFTEQHFLDREAWVLLHCYYKQKHYLPGMEFTRMHYENLYDVPGKTLPLIPLSLYESFIPTDFELSGKVINGKKFYEVFKTFACLGAYEFAELIFNEIEEEFTITERYLVRTTLMMLQGKIDSTFQVKRLQTDNTQRGKLMSYFQAHINGNVEYSRRRYDEAIKNYLDLLTINLTDTEVLSMFYLSLMRLARLSLENQNYEVSLLAYEMCTPVEKSDKNFAANYGMGLSLYYRNRLEDAIEYLSRCTENDVFLPDPWGYLAVINLRLGCNKAALECWKIAKMYPEMVLSNRIYDELQKIKYSQICLLVEDECKPP